MADELISQDGQCPIDLPQGAPFDMELTLMGPNPDNPDDDDDLVALDLTDYEGRAEMHETAGGLLQLTFEITVSHDIDGADKGKVWVHSDASANATVIRNGVWDLELYNPDDETDEVPIFTESPVRLKRKVTSA